MLFTTLAASGKQVVHVLEVGCGTGMPMQDLLDILPKFLSPVTELHSASRIRTCAPPHTISKTLEEQGIFLGPFHVMAVLQVLHGTTTLAHRMSSILDLLVPGGYVLTVDFDGNAWCTGFPGTLWYDFIIGGFQECVTARWSSARGGPRRAMAKRPLPILAGLSGE
ncbi:hypothetical protein JB92DRAFT_2838485 [Gautieria morchelliformis]|nr:hypothetical protein JB92DRAFT_2838485 [Gautieria morchelliformis]